MIGFAKDGLVKSFRADRLVVRIYPTREQMGQAAAAAVADEVLRLIAGYGAQLVSSLRHLHRMNSSPL